MLKNPLNIIMTDIMHGNEVNLFWKITGVFSRIELGINN